MNARWRDVQLHWIFGMIRAVSSIHIEIAIQAITCVETGFDGVASRPSSKSSNTFSLSQTSSGQHY